MYHVSRVNQPEDINRLINAFVEQSTLITSKFTLSKITFNQLFLELRTRY